MLPTSPSRSPTPLPITSRGRPSVTVHGAVTDTPLIGALNQYALGEGGRSPLLPATHADALRSEGDIPGGGAGGAALQRGAASPAIGLVHSQTSATPIHLDPVATRLSRLKSGTITAARLHQEQVQKGGFRGRWAFLTLTYADADAWKPRHLPELLDHVRKWLARRGHALSYVWVAEIQPGRFRRTGQAVIHYHCMLWLPRGLTIPKPDKQGWWKHGSSKVEWARNPVGYMAKYSSKADGPAKFPKGARIHGCGGLRGDQRQEAQYWRRPRWLRESTAIQDQVRRRVGGGWIDAESGEIFESPWEVIFSGGGVWIKRRDSCGGTPDA